MARKRLSMRKIREILRQKWVLRRSHREIARSLCKGTGTISVVASRAATAGLSWTDVEGLSDAELEGKLYPKPQVGKRTHPDYAYIHTELRRPGVTLQLLHLEHLEAHPGDGCGYTQFCTHYKRWRGKQQRSMRQVHRAGEKTFIDYAGKKPQLANPRTGEITEVELFVAVLGASNFTYAEATRSQKSYDFQASHVRAFAYFGGVSELLVPDQLKSAVTQACRYEPGVNRDYEKLAQHYEMAVLPARPRKPKDKAKVEVAVQVVERWILARLRNETFFSLVALNRRIAELLEELNDKPMRTYGASRRAMFERFDKPALRPLPTERFQPGTWKRAKVNIDCHVELEKHYYSAPHPLVGEEVEIRFTATTVEVFHGNRRVASHLRSWARGQHTTEAAHLPKSHQKHLKWTPSRLIHWGESVGPHTGKLVEAILADRPHPEQGYRSCLGILRLARRYDNDRLEAACKRALRAGGRSYRHIDAILKKGLDRVPLEEQTEPTVSPISTHENVRGGQYYEESNNPEPKQGELPNVE
jgi:transposase